MHRRGADRPAKTSSISKIPEFYMKIAVIHDYANALRGTRAYARLSGHEVVVHTDAYTDPARVVEQVAG